jgi:hypothetical protein
MSFTRAARIVAAAIPGLCQAMSCGGAAPALQAPAAASQAAAAPLPPPPPDLSAVRDPPALVLYGGLSKPSASLSTLRGWSKLPMPLPQEVTEALVGEAVGPLVDLDQSIQFAVAVAGTGMHVHDRMAVSAALKDIDQAKAILSERFKLVPGDSGVLHIQRLKRASSADDDQGPDDGSDEGLRACELAPAYGVAAMRLVCGSAPRALAELGPWLARTATRTTTASDVHVELRMRPLRSIIAVQKRLIGSVLASAVGPRLELGGARELLSSIGGDVVDFAVDLDEASLDLQLSDATAAATMTMRFSSTSSALARIATSHPEKSAPAPAAFWQLPSDADCAFFDRGIDPAELARGRDLVLRAVADGLAELGLKDADRKPIVEALGKMTSSAPMAYASGFDTDAVAKAHAAEKALRDGSDVAATANAKHALAEALLGWRLIEIDEPSGAFAAAAKELVAGWARPTVGAAYRARAKGSSPPVLRAAPMPRGMTMPGGQHFVLELRPFDSSAPAGAGTPGKPKSGVVASRAVAIHVFLVADGSRTWVGLGGSEVLVATKLASAMAPAVAGGLAGRPELTLFKTNSIGAGGFATARGLPAAAEQLAVLFGDSTGIAADALSVASQLPHQGVVPVTFELTASGDGGSPALTTSLQLPRAAIEDVVAAILMHGF